jgi:hypothetical protein
MLLYWLSCITDTEMSEGGWKTFPHCCDQGQCWMHTPNNGSWCRCICFWCKTARKFNRGVVTLDLEARRKRRNEIP